MVAPLTVPLTPECLERIPVMYLLACMRWKDWNNKPLRVTKILQHKRHVIGILVN